MHGDLLSEVLFNFSDFDIDCIRQECIFLKSAESKKVKVKENIP